MIRGIFFSLPSSSRRMDDTQSEDGFPYSSGSSTSAGLDFDSYLLSPGAGDLHFDPGGLSSHASTPGTQSFSDDWDSFSSNLLGTGVSPHTIPPFNHARMLSLSGSSSISPAPSLQRRVVSPAPVQRLQQLEKAYSTLRQENLLLGAENQTIKCVSISSMSCHTLTTIF